MRRKKMRCKWNRLKSFGGCKTTYSVLEIHPLPSRPIGFIIPWHYYTLQPVSTNLRRKAQYSIIHWYERKGLFCNEMDEYCHQAIPPSCPLTLSLSLSSLTGMRCQKQFFIILIKPLLLDWLTFHSINLPQLFLLWL